MQRSKIRKVVAAMHPGLPEVHLKKALSNIHSDKTRRRVESRIRRRDAAR